VVAAVVDVNVNFKKLICHILWWLLIERKMFCLYVFLSYCAIVRSVGCVI